MAILLLVLSGCELIRISAKGQAVEQGPELTRETAMGTSLLYVAELGRGNARAAARMHDISSDKTILSDYKSAGTAEKRFALMADLVLLSEEIEASPARKCFFMGDEDADKPRIRVVTERSDTLELSLIEKSGMWYVAESEFLPYKIN